MLGLASVRSSSSGYDGNTTDLLEPHPAWTKKKDRFHGLVVRRPPREREVWGSITRFSRSSWSRDLKTGTLWEGAGIAQSVVCWARCPAWCSVVGSVLLWASGRRDFPLGVNMGSDSIPHQKPFLDDSINRGLVYAHMHSTAQTQKILIFMSWTGDCRQQKHTQHALSTKTECDTLNGWIKKRSHSQKSHPKWWPQEIYPGTQKKKKVLSGVPCQVPGVTESVPALLLRPTLDGDAYRPHESSCPPQLL